MNKIENKEILNPNNLSFKYGIVAGIAMAAFLLMFQINGADYSPFLKWFKYLFLGLTLIIALGHFKRKHEDRIFVKGIGMGTKLSLIAGLVLILINMVLYLTLPELAFSKYNLEPHTFLQYLSISMILFFETLVFGSIITFTILQYLKGDPIR
jgi:hypothetical protein